MLAPGSLLSRTVALLLLAGAVLAGYQFVVAPVVAAYRDSDEAIERNQALLQRYLRLAAERPALDEMVAEQEALVADAAGYLQGGSEALAAAELQNRVKELVENAGGTLHSTQNLRSSDDDDAPARRATVRVRFSVDIEGLAQVLYELETGEPYLFVEEVTIRELRERRRRRNEPEPGPMLDVGLDVYGYLRESEA